MPDQDVPAGNRRGDRTQEWRPTVSYMCAKEPNDRVEDELDAEFDQLLDQSSLGTPVAQAYQALTPDRVHKRLRTQLQRLAADPDEAAAARGGPDTDEVVLDVVRSAVGDELPDIEPDTWMKLVGGCDRVLGDHSSLSIYTQLPWVWPPNAAAEDRISCREVATFAYHLRLSAHVPRYRTWAVTLLNKMVYQGVFVDLRPDVARSIVELGFDRTDEDTPVALLLACSLAVSSSGIADELTDISAFPVSAITLPREEPGTAHEEVAFWRSTTLFYTDLLARNWLVRLTGAGSWKAIERGPLGTPRPALTCGKRNQPEHRVSSVDTPAARRRPRWRPFSGTRRRHRSVRQRRSARRAPARPAGAPARLVSREPEALAAVGSWSGFSFAFTSGGVGILLFGVLLLLARHLP
ncbi:Uncharacterised protein [Amycolatopsis camponoti]|uniref:Uncharacterized protein n=1 Tax=Amycolatopsis camponoti TaxID=2606593 RepID=A0A6I8M035_9PSEU|nr:hypothetical protein [Amycolatopsis camponoti]VVJ22744.1 Uncharacterised protein [Amycolatopsis camponoti]